MSKRALAGDDGNDRPYKQTVVQGILQPKFTSFGVEKDLPRPFGTNSGYSAAMRIREDDAFQAALVSTTSRGVIRGTGRQQPLHQQSSIVQTVCARKTEYDRRNKNAPEDMIAPLGDRLEHTIQPGDLLFTPKEANQVHPLEARKRHNTIQNFGDVVVSSTVNGHHRNEGGDFAGFAVNVSDAKDMNTDIALTSLVFGSYTSVNTGPLTIRPGDFARMSLTPYVTVQAGKVVPAIEQQGVPKMKFRPATYPYNATTVKELAAKAAEAAVDAANEQAMQDDYDEKDYEDRVERVCREFNRKALFDETNQPIHMYIRYCILQLGYLGNRRNLAKARDVARRYWEQELANSNVRSGNPFLVVAVPPELESQEESSFLQFIEKRKTALVADQDHKLRGSLIGKCLNLSAPGQALDLLVNVHPS
jgi:hypothetical protein